MCGLVRGVGGLLAGVGEHTVLVPAGRSKNVDGRESWWAQGNCCGGFENVPLSEND